MSTKGKSNLSRERIEFYSPISIALKANKKNIFDTENKIVTSSNVDYPRFEHGFHHYIHSDKNKTKVLDSFKGKKKVYYVMNEFERYIDDYDNDIGSLSKNYFNLKNKPEIITRSFYKMWEIFFYFDLVDISSKNFTSIHISNGPNPFAQATMLYRDMYGDSKKDSYHALTSTEKNTPLQDEFEKFYKKNVEYSNNISAFEKNVSGKADLITGDRGKGWNLENIQEQQSFDIIFEQIICAVKNQNKGGHFVCKFFETFTITSLKFVSMLSQLYTEVHFTKPLMSRGSNSEKYAICKGFKLSDKESKSLGKDLDEMYKKMHTLDKKSFLVDIFPNFEIEDEFKVSMITINKTIANEQLKSINLILEYVDGMNYHGDTYRNSRDKQIKASEHWSGLFFPEPKKIETHRSQAKELISKDRMKIGDEYDKLYQVLTLTDKSKRQQSRTTKKTSKSKSKVTKTKKVKVKKVKVKKVIKSTA